MQMADLRYDLPDERGHFGPYGGVFVAETLIRALDELKEQYARYQQRSPRSWPSSTTSSPTTSAGRRPVYHAKRWSAKAGGAQIWLKREDLNHTGAHKINNCIGQALLAKRMGKPRVIAETGAGQHGVATATVAARFGMECVVYMGDGGRQAPGAERLPDEAARRDGGAGRVAARKTLKDAMNEAMRDWVTNVETTFYIIGTVAGPASVSDDGPRFPERDRPRVPGADAGGSGTPAGRGGRVRRRRLECDGHLPPVPRDAAVKLIGVEAAGEGLATGQHAASLTAGRPGVLHGNRTYLLQDADGQIAETHSISAGLDYPGVGPEHAWLKDSGRASTSPSPTTRRSRRFTSAAGSKASSPRSSPRTRSRMPPGWPRRWRTDKILLVNLSGRGDKDMNTVAERSGLKFHCRPECDPAKR